MPHHDKRPLSPHLQVYRLPLTAILSISHRISGVFLCLGVVLLIGMLLLLAEGPRAYAQGQAVLASLPGKTILVLFTYALYFHFCNGIRHLFWDAGYGFELHKAERANYIVLIASLLLTVATWWLAGI